MPTTDMFIVLFAVLPTILKMINAVIADIH